MNFFPGNWRRGSTNLCLPSLHVVSRVSQHGCVGAQLCKQWAARVHAVWLNVRWGICCPLINLARSKPDLFTHSSAASALAASRGRLTSRVKRALGSLWIRPKVFEQKQTLLLWSVIAARSDHGRFGAWEATRNDWCGRWERDLAQELEEWMWAEVFEVCAGVTVKSHADGSRHFCSGSSLGRCNCC